MKLSKTILNPQQAWPFNPPKKPKRGDKKKALRDLLNSLPKAPF